ncbi:bacillithiol system redox-active protein YtxJ [Gaetbulibacter sp. M235]|uniref:bacillithiol system redox-active protein YtxJ n=1 Tax=Gaetbulibacter sp. M235 TaxID=3126510 RepID=UPI00374E483C
MGLLNKLFNSSSENKDEKELPWNILTSLSQLGDIKEKSLLKTQLIFKHSTRCGVSRMVKNQFLKDYDFTEKDFDLYYLDLIEYRAISNEIAQTFHVYHESPQLLVIKNGTAVANKSHGAINDLDLKGYL